jgi:Carboxypeptidase regulatory-like domain
VNQHLPTSGRDVAQHGRAGVSAAQGRRPRSVRALLAALLGSVALLALAPVAVAQASGAIAGTVSEAAGTHSPIEHVEVEVLNPTTQAIVDSATTGAGGEYEVAGLAPGSYKVHFRPPSESQFVAQYFSGKGSFAEAEEVTVVESTTTKNVDAALGEGGTISGTVLKEGVPAGGIIVEVFPQGGSESFFGFTTSAGNGKYTVKGVPVGTYTVGFFPQFGENLVTQFYNEKNSFAEATPLKVGFEENREAIDANLQVGGEITGTVTDAVTHKPLPEVFVSASREGAEYFGFGETDANGNYTVAGLLTGAYDLEFESFAAGPSYMTLTDNGVGVTQRSVTSGINVSLTPNAPHNSSAPVASGVGSAGQTLSCSTGSWTGAATLKYTYQWTRDGSAIAGATSSAYLVQAGDQGHGLACQVTATNAAGHATATSNTIAVAVPVPPKPPILVPHARILASRIVVSRGVARIPLSCAPAAPCAGSVQIVQQVTVKVHRGHRTIKRRRTIVLGRRSYSLAAGHGAVIRVSLTGTAKSRLARARGHRLAATLIVTVRGASTLRKAVTLVRVAPPRRR